MRYSSFRRLHHRPTALRVVLIKKRRGCQALTWSFQSGGSSQKQTGSGFLTPKSGIIWTLCQIRNVSGRKIFFFIDNGTFFAYSIRYVYGICNDCYVYSKVPNCRPHSNKRPWYLIQADLLLHKKSKNLGFCFKKELPTMVGYQRLKSSPLFFQPITNSTQRIC